MTIKDSFTEEEWAGVLQAPMLAGVAVTAADPGGIWGALKEATAMTKSMLKPDAAVADDSLLSGVTAAYETSDGRGIAQDGVKGLLKGKKPAEASQAAVARLGEIAAVVAAKAPAEADTFKKWLKAIAQNVAEASKEGGFLGFGGEQVSESEKQTLDAIDQALV